MEIDEWACVLRFKNKKIVLLSEMNFWEVKKKSPMKLIENAKLNNRKSIENRKERFLYYYQINKINFLT